MSIDHHRPLPGPKAPPRDDEFHKSLVDHISDGVYYVDSQRRILYWNKAAECITGFGTRDVVGRCCADGILMHVDEAGQQLCQMACPLVASMRDDEPRETVLWLRHHEGQRVPVRLRTAPVHDAQGRVTGAVEIFDDASGLLEAEAQMVAASRDSLRDSLTELPNRRHLDTGIRARLEDLRRHGWSFGLLVIDIDHFKAVNDSYGHGAGDAALRTVAATIAGSVRRGDLAGRWGGDEFVVAANGSDERSLRDVGERCRALVASSRMQLKGLHIALSVSVGAALALPSDDPHELFARADSALYQAKAGGRDQVVMATTPA